MTKANVSRQRDYLSYVQPTKQPCHIEAPRD